MTTPKFAKMFDQLGGAISIKPMRQKARIRASPSLADSYVKQKNRLKSFIPTSREVTKSPSVAETYIQQKNRLKSFIITSHEVTESTEINSIVGVGDVDGYDTADTQSSLESTDIGVADSRYPTHDKQSILSQDKMNKKKSNSETKVVDNVIEKLKKKRRRQKNEKKKKIVSALNDKPKKALSSVNINGHGDKSRKERRIVTKKPLEKTRIACGDNKIHKVEHFKMQSKKVKGKERLISDSVISGNKFMYITEIKPHLPLPTLYDIDSDCKNDSDGPTVGSLLLFNRGNTDSDDDEDDFFAAHVNNYICNLNGDDLFGRNYKYTPSSQPVKQPAQLVVDSERKRKRENEIASDLDVFFFISDDDDDDDDDEELDLERLHHLFSKFKITENQIVKFEEFTRIERTQNAQQIINFEPIKLRISVGGETLKNVIGFAKLIKYAAQCTLSGEWTGNEIVKWQTMGANIIFYNRQGYSVPVAAPPTIPQDEELGTEISLDGNACYETEKMKIRGSNGTGTSVRINKLGENMDIQFVISTKYETNTIGFDDRGNFSLNDSYVKTLIPYNENHIDNESVIKTKITKNTSHNYATFRVEHWRNDKLVNKEKMKILFKNKLKKMNCKCIVNQQNGSGCYTIF